MTVLSLELEARRRVIPVTFIQYEEHYRVVRSTVMGTTVKSRKEWKMIDRAEGGWT
ncbi:hypothetical protein GWK48_10360 [Metallosphaera tengchongensis]|uniref:Uncharacterized protein n=1 Tax=Metallosphaera tengchongensis TaxID=1532350 RepID=A0A6N0NV94_9CREN|nr:hypothetical protein [Metallosphaera tengchongensis]QKR00736.1 hypothetical protein GWK48_10360 [Metallosphaera tengchongensis]